MNHRVSELYKIINDAQNELNNIRLNCTHAQGYHIAYYSWRIGSIHPSRICDICDSPINGITQEEIKIFLDAEEQRNKEWRKANNIPEEFVQTGVIINED